MLSEMKENIYSRESVRGKVSILNKARLVKFIGRPQQDGIK